MRARVGCRDGQAEIPEMAARVGLPKVAVHAVAVALRRGLAVQPPDAPARSHHGCRDRYGSRGIGARERHDRRQDGCCRALGVGCPLARAARRHRRHRCVGDLLGGMGRDLILRARGRRHLGRPRERRDDRARVQDRGARRPGSTRCDGVRYQATVGRVQHDRRNGDPAGQPVRGHSDRDPRLDEPGTYKVRWYASEHEPRLHEVARFRTTVAG